MPRRIKGGRGWKRTRDARDNAAAETGPQTPNELIERLDAALARRRDVRGRGDVSAVRLVHDVGDDLPGVVIEQYNDALVLQVHEGRCRLREALLREGVLHVQRVVGARAVYRKDFPRDRSNRAPRSSPALYDPKPWLGEPVEEELTIAEHGARYCVRLFDGFSTGLFLEQRDNRARVREWAAGKRVLNGFAYTCAFSIAAALGGAAETVSVDVSKRYLEWGKRNFAANELSVDGHWFICDDMLNYWKRAARQERHFDLIILDPPTFGRSKQTGETFQLRNDLQHLLRGAVDRLAPGGTILLCTNHRTTTRAALEAGLKTAGAARGVEIVDRPALPADFPHDEAFAKSVVARFDGER